MLVKKILIFPVIFASFVLTGCGNNSSDEPVIRSAVIKLNDEVITLTHQAYFIDDVAMCDVKEISPYLNADAEYSKDMKVCSITRNNLMIFVGIDQNDFSVTDLNTMSSTKHPLKKASIKTDYGIDVSIEDYADSLGYTTTIVENEIRLSY